LARLLIINVFDPMSILFHRPHSARATEVSQKCAVHSDIILLMGSIYQLLQYNNSCYDIKMPIIPPF